MNRSTDDTRAETIAAQDNAEVESTYVSTLSAEAYEQGKDDRPLAEYEVWVTVLRMDGATGDVDEHTATAEGSSLPDALATASRKALQGVLKHG